MLLAIFSIVLRGRILGWALLGKSVISTIQLFYKANRQHHPLNQSSQSHPKIFIYGLERGGGCKDIT